MPSCLALASHLGAPVMKKHLDYFVVLNSPFCYLGAKRLMALRDEYDLTVAVKPVNLASLFEATGGTPLAQRHKARRNYRLAELDRWSRYLEQPIDLEPAPFPCDESLAAATLIAAEEMDLDALDLSRRYGQGLWRDNRDIGKNNVVLELLNEQAISTALFDQAHNGYYRDKIAANTQEAIALGIFGVPSYYFNDTVFWGQDRLDFVEMLLTDNGTG